MRNISAAEVENLCDSWCDASSHPDGGLVIGGETEKFRLLNNGVLFHELTHESLSSAIIGLSKVLLRPGLNTIIHEDHYGLWSWAGEILLSHQSGIFPDSQNEIRSLYATCIHAALTGCRKPTTTMEEWKEQGRIEQLQPHHSKLFLQNSGLSLAYLVFPLLEAILKRSCSTYVDFDGSVISPFTVPKKQGGVRTYGPAGQPGDKKCSSLRDMLYLHRTVVAAPSLGNLIDRFRSHLAFLDSTLDPFDLLYAWRNQSLHGTTNFQTIGGTVLNYSLLISISEIEKNFEDYRVQAVQRCEWEAKSMYKSPWSFYPPY